MKKARLHARPMSKPGDQAPNSVARVREAARNYTSRGWATIPVPHGKKNPGYDKWQQSRITLDEIPRRFTGQRQNIGILLGEPSRGLVDIDLDNNRCVDLADQYLPETPAVFGRPGKPRSHRIYRVTSPAMTRKFKSKSAGMLVEFRSTGMQTVFPPSVHESGEPIEWETPGVEPAEIDPEELLEAVTRLADAVKVELGEKASAASKASRSRAILTPPTSAAPAPASVPTGERNSLCLVALRRIGIVDQRDGSHRLFACACRAVEYDLDDTSALAVIRDYARERPFPRAWTDDEILKRVRDAENRCVRGGALKTEPDGCVLLGGRDPATGRLVLSPKRTLPTADAYVREFHLHPDGRTIVSFAGTLMEWSGNRYVEVEDQSVKKRLQLWLHQSLRYAKNPKTGELELIDFESNSASIKGALESIQAYAHIPGSTISPSWLTPQPGDPPPLGL